MLVKQKRSAVLTVVLYVFLCGVVISAWIASKWILNQFHSFPDPITRTTPIVYAQSSSPAAVEDQLHSSDILEKELQSVVDSFVASQSGKYAVYVEHLATGAVAQHRADVPMTAASMYKLFVANEALKMVDENRLILDAIVDGKRELTLRECLEIVITVSDNDCGVILQRVTGATNAILPQLKTQGFDDTDLRGHFPKTSASDIARLYKNLTEETYLSEASNQLLLYWLAGQRIQNRIPQGLPSGTEVLHKTGDLKGYVHDGGIVRNASGDYIVSVMSQPDPAVNYQQRYSRIAELTSALHKTISEVAP